MFQASKKPSSTMINSHHHHHHHHHERPMCGDSSGLVLTTDPKPRLRWTVELHERFVDAVTQLGGPDKATPKTIMKVMRVEGLTLYHLKSHLQKFRLGKQPHKDFNDHSIKDATSLELHRNHGAAASTGMLGRTNNVQLPDAIRMQMEVNRRLHEQLEVQRHLQLRIEAQGKYMQTILEKACQTLAAGETNLPSGSFHKIGPEFLGMKEFGPAAASINNFPSFQDLNMYTASSDQLDLHHHLTALDTSFLGKKRPNPYADSTGKGPMIWAEDLRLHQELGTSAHLNDNDDDNAMAPALSMDRGSDHHHIVDSVSDVKYETKPILSGDQLSTSGGDKKFDVSTKVERLNAAAAAAGGMTRGYVVK